MKFTFNSSKKSKQPVVDDGLEVKYAQSKRSGYRKRWYMLLILVLAPIIWVIWLAVRPFLLILAPGIITSEPLEIKTFSASFVSQVMVDDGSKVNLGDTLLILVNGELEAQIKELTRQVEELQKQDGVNEQGIIATLQKQILVAAEGLRRQNELLASYQNFRDKGVVPTSDMAVVLQTNTAAKMELERSNVALLLEQSKQLREQKAGVIAQQRNQIMLQLAQLTARKEALIIKAPFSGQVEELLVQQGERVAVQQPLLWLQGKAEPVVVTYVNEKYLEYVEIGQQATINLPNGESVRAEILKPTQIVSKIPQQLSGPFDGQKSAIKVTLTLKEPLSFAVEGIPVEVRFDYRFWD